MYVELIVNNKRSSVRRLVIREFALIGRNEKCDIRVISSEISREHCRLEVDQAELILIDLGSTNGTFVDGVRVEAHQEISVNPQSRIQIGPATFLVNFIDVDCEQETISPEETHHLDQENEEEALGELPISIEEVAEETISENASEETQEASQELKEEEGPLPASIASDAEIPIQSEDTAFDDFLKGI